MDFHKKFENYKRFGTIIAKCPILFQKSLFDNKVNILSPFIVFYHQI
ncbi:hypothetical protein MCERE19_04360 [Spirosomataceae bacterium]|jgi:hypothetical protein